MNAPLMFSRASDEWATPQALFAQLDAEFGFTLDAAAQPENALVSVFLSDALTVPWSGVVWLNPPYSQCRAFVQKAAAEAARGCTVVCLLPARTDTRWWHDYVWDRTTHHPRTGVEVRFLKGRLTFGAAVNPAPFPSVVVVFRCC